VVVFYYYLKTLGEVHHFSRGTSLSLKYQYWRLRTKLKGKEMLAATD
jgi:hypothetical protein